ncbi:MAG: hypothetical protein DCF32_03910 [Leptolyngbya sp.]|nr:MAG: hypothetical protein DCF32_03910 [Leptolyngbya sp.]
MGKPIREVRGRIPQDLKIAFEVACARLEVSQANALEDAIREWLLNRSLPISEQPLEVESAKKTSSSP